MKRATRTASFALWLPCVIALAVDVSAQDDEGFQPEDVPIAIRSGLDYLLNEQNEDGSWGGVVNATFTSSFANPATYRMWQMGTTALATRSLLESDLGETAHAAVERGLDYLIANASVKRPAEWDVDNNWAIVYGLDTVARALQHPRYKGSAKEAELRGAGKTLLEELAKYQSPNGGWGYYSSPMAGWRPEWATSFMTGVAVLAMVEAREAGLDVDDKMFKAGIKAVEMTRLPSGAYEYDLRGMPRHLRLESINQIKGSLGRIQVCNLALWRTGGDVKMEDLEWGLEQFVKHRKFLVVARNKPIPHEAYYANAAYFYLFGHYYAARVLEVVSPEVRAKWAPHIQGGFLEARQESGAMWDFWIASSTKPYGTSFGVMGLAHTLSPSE